jgi:hypothetical protein
MKNMPNAIMYGAVLREGADPVLLSLDTLGNVFLLAPSNILNIRAVADHCS